MKNNKRFFIVCFTIAIVVCLSIAIVILNHFRKNKDDIGLFVTIPLFLEVTAADDVEFDHENQFGFPVVYMFHQEPDVPRILNVQWGQNVSIGETEFSIPISIPNIKEGEVAELQIYQMSQKMIIEEDEWVSDSGWLIDESVFYITIELVVEDETNRFEIVKTRYEKGNHVQVEDSHFYEIIKNDHAKGKPVDEIRFMNHYLGSD